MTLIDTALPQKRGPSTTSTAAARNHTLTVGTGDVSTAGIDHLRRRRRHGHGGIDNHLKAGIDAGVVHRDHRCSRIRRSVWWPDLLDAVRNTSYPRQQRFERLLHRVRPATTTLDLIGRWRRFGDTFGNGDPSLIDGPVQIINNQRCRRPRFSNDTLANPTSNVAYTIADTSFTHSGMGLVTWNGMSRIQLRLQRRRQCDHAEYDHQHALRAQRQWRVDSFPPTPRQLQPRLPTVLPPRSSTARGTDILNVNSRCNRGGSGAETAQDFSNMTISTGGSVPTCHVERSGQSLDEWSILSSARSH